MSKLTRVNRPSSEDRKRCFAVSKTAVSPVTDENIVCHTPRLRPITSISQSMPSLRSLTRMPTAVSSSRMRSDAAQSLRPCSPVRYGAASPPAGDTKSRPPADCGLLVAQPEDIEDYRLTVAVSAARSAAVMLCCPVGELVDDAHPVEQRRNGHRRVQVVVHRLAAAALQLGGSTRRHLPTV